MILIRNIRLSIVFLFSVFFLSISHLSFADECAQRFPGTIPEASCSGCQARGKICVPRESYSTSPDEHVVCYECVESPQQCRDQGWIDLDQCRSCESILDNACVLAGKTSLGEVCYQCVSQTDTQCS